MIGLETELGPALSAATTAAGAFVEREWSGVTFCLALGEPVYQFGEQVEIFYIVTNNNRTPVRIQFPSGCQFFFNVYEGGDLVYDPPIPCTAAITELFLPPGEMFVYSRRWEQVRCVGDCGPGEPAWPGHYSLVGYLDTHEDISEVTVEFEITGNPQQKVSGYLAEDTTLDKDESPYHVSSDLIVPEGVTLTIEPGVVLLFDHAQGNLPSAAGLHVEGTLLARGTPKDKIIFRSVSSSPTSADWKGITFSSTAKDASFDEMRGRYTDGCILEHCIIEHAATPLRMEDSSPLVSNCIIRNNGCPDGTPYQLIAGPDSNALLVNTIITKNRGSISGDFAIANSIIWGNWSVELEGFSAICCCIEKPYSGPENIDADPLLVDLDRKDYHLRPDSPCIDAGTSDADGMADKDMEGEVRISGNEVDIGIDEYVDSDNDQLPDYLEMRYFGFLSFDGEDDLDSDGLTNAQEVRYGTNPAIKDTDRDGIHDGKELAAGTDPLDPESCLKITGLGPGDFETRLWWKSVPGRRYCVFVSEDMQTWLPRSGELTASSGTLVFVDSHDESVRHRFYRIEALP